ncbi:MAG TPA: FAD-binding oxidoreductase [Gemmatimonadales bacterium]|jgi:FAD/FMN-containing dehydrogenase
MQHEAAIADLRARLRGSLILPQDGEYEDARSVWNGMIDRRPALVIRCLGVADVAAGLAYAREHGLGLSIKGGGHNIAGHAVADGVVTLDLSPMRGVQVDPVARLAWVQAGCRLSDVDRETQLHGLAAPLGFVSTTGVGGLTLGGGFGYLTRRCGWSCDNVVAFDVVTADGRILRASESKHPDLFWALRGGGGNFAVVTAFTFRLAEVGPEILGGAIAWPAEEAPQVLDLFRRLTSDAPPKLALVAGLRKAPPTPWLASAYHGKDIVALFICHTGDVAEGERLVAPLKRHGVPIGDIVQRRTYLSQQTLLDSTQPKGRRYYWKSEYLPDHEPDLLTAGAVHARRMPSPHSAILFFPLDGAINWQREDLSPAGNRDARSLFNIAASWEQPGDDAENIAWTLTAWKDLRRFSTGGTYVNFLTEEERTDRIQAAYGRHYDRLAKIKHAWDPSNLFRHNQNIPPCGDGFQPRSASAAHAPTIT